MKFSFVLVLVVGMILFLPISDSFALRQIAGIPEIAVYPGGIEEFTWGLASDNSDDSITVYIRAEGAGSEFLIYPESVLLKPGIIEYVTILIKVPEDHDDTITSYSPSLYATEILGITVGGTTILITMEKPVNITILNHLSDIDENNSGGGNGCNGDCIYPTIGLDKNSIRLVDNGFTYNDQSVDALPFYTQFPLINATTGHTNTISATVYDNLAIELVQFGLGLPEIDSPLNDAEVILEVWLDAYASEDPIQVDKIVIRDPHNLIDNSSVKIHASMIQCRADSNDQCVNVKVQHMYREAPIYNMVGVEVMDTNNNVQHTTFNDGIDVLGDSMNPSDILYVTSGIPKNHPNTSSIMQLTQVDRAEKLYSDSYGYIWTGDDSKITLLSDIPFEPFQDSFSEFSGYNDRNNSNFIDYKNQQLPKAQDTFDYLTSYKQIQIDDE